MISKRIFIIALWLIPLSAVADTLWQNTAWRPILRLGAGLAFIQDAGQSQNFAIQNPASDEFYDYAADNTTQTPAISEAFLGLQWQQNPQWAWQFGLNYTQTTAFHANGTLTQGANVSSDDTYNDNYTIASKQWLLEAKLLNTQLGLYHPYVSAGTGVAFNQVSDYQTSVPYTETFTRMYANNTTTTFSYTLGTGLDIDLSEHLRLGVGYRFSDLGHVSLGDATIDSTPVSGTLAQSHLYAQTLLAQLTWLL